MSEDLQGVWGRINRHLNPPMPKRLPEDQDLFRVKDAAVYFDVHEKTLRDMIRRGEVQIVKHGMRETYIARDEIRHYWRRKSA